MKTLRYVKNKHINESANVFSDDLYNQSLIYAIREMDDGEVKHALYVMDAYHTSFDQCTEYDRFMNGIDDWCESHDVPFELWDEKSDYDREAAFFKAYSLVYDHNGERIVENEGSEQFTKADFKAAALYANSQLTQSETDYALDRWNEGIPVHRIQHVSDKLSSLMDEWCEEHGFDVNDWTMFGDVNDVFFADSIDEEKEAKEDEPLEESADNSESLRKDCYNIAYNMCLSKEAERMDKQSLAKVSMSFNEGFNGVQLESIVDIPSKPVFGKANKMGQVARQLGDVGKFMHYLELEYDLV